MQAICIVKILENICFEIERIKIQPENEVKLIYDTKDLEHIIFSSHIWNKRKKTSQQLNVLKRIKVHLSRLGKFIIIHS